LKYQRRKYIKFLSISFLSLFFLPYKFLLAVKEKIINPELTDEQKRIMFKEATERPFSSSLNNEKRKGFFHCANCGAKLFHLRQSLIVVQAGLLFRIFTRGI